VVTVIDAPPQAERDDAQLLFQEAKQRRRRRWLLSGIVSLVVLAAVGLTIAVTSSRGGGGSLKPAPVPAVVAGVDHPSVSLSFRPVLCYAPPFAPAAGQGASTGPLPACSPATALTASNLAVTPQAGNVNGYRSNTNVAADPQYATYPSTPLAEATPGNTVLLPGTPAEGSDRYVLGPAGLTNDAIKSANAQLNDGQWSINLDLTDNGSVQWDAMASQQFHQIIGVDVNGRVISAPIMQPTQSSFSSFNGRVQISGSFTQAQAKKLASEPQVLGSAATPPSTPRTRSIARAWGGGDS
jgi:hypothetical protein